MINHLFSWLERFTPPFPDQAPVRPPRTLLAFVVHYAKPFWPLLLACSLLASIVAVLEVVLFSFVGNLVDLLATADPATFWEQHQAHLFAMGVLVLVILPALKFFYEAVVHQGLMGNFPMRIRWQGHRYLLRQSMTFFQDDFAGRVATKLMQTALAVRDTVLKITEVMVYVSVYFLSAMVLFALNDPRLSLFMVLWLVGYIATMAYFVPRLQAVSQRQADARSLVTGRIVDSYTNIATVKMFADSGYEDRYAHRGMEHFLGTVNDQMRLSTLLTIILHLLNAGLIFGTAAVGVWLWQQGLVSAGALAFAVGLVLRLQGMSQWILWEVAILFENIGVVQDGVDTLARERDINDAPGAQTLAVTRGEIHYDHIHFNYGKRREAVDKGVIDDLSLTIHGGEKIGIVGRSGAGKSTMVNLLLRFYDLESGRILIDGQDTAQVTQESLRRHIGMVTQDTSLMHRSVLENIRYGRSGASLEEVIAAANKAHAHEFILGLADVHGRTGYDAHVGERGVKLSGGQRQRIAIARVLLKDAPILVLDEATSALDSEVEMAIQENLYQLMAGKTVLAIAHRLSTIAAMDRLVVMDRGRIVEQGTHDELLASGGLYAELWARQSGGFLVVGQGNSDDAVPAADYSLASNG
ncbi:MAG: ABC transporter ATP-binding protein [Candidatus Competibacterales bacterium]